MTEITTITLPDYDHQTENWAEVGMEAWIKENGGTDVTCQLPDHDEYSEWVGDWADADGEVYRLLVNAMTGEINAYTLEVRFDLDEDITHGGEHIWTGAEWLAETRDEDAICADILADLDDDAEGDFVAILGERI